MEVKLSKSNLEVKHIKHAVTDALNFIDGRRKGNIKSLKTRWLKFNKNCMGGIEWNSFYVIAGMSGSGKSSMANELETALFDYNPDEEFVVLSFNLEMLAYRQVGRKLSYKMERTVSELYSAEVPITDEEFAQLEKHAVEVAKYPIYYVDIPGTVEEMRAVIIAFANKFPGKGVMVMLDHGRLVKRLGNQAERNMLEDLCFMFMTEKKQRKLSVIMLSQLNREIEKPERIQFPEGHYPLRGDLFGADAIYQSADYVMVLHRPEMLNIQAYGLESLPTEGYIFLHILKHRDGEPLVLRLVNNLKFNRIDE